MNNKIVYITPKEVGDSLYLTDYEQWGYNQDDVLNSSSDEQIAYEFIKKNLSENKDHNAIILSGECKTEDAINLICSLRLQNFQKLIVWISDEPFEQVSVKMGKMKREILLTSSIKFYFADYYAKSADLQADIQKCLNESPIPYSKDVIIHPPARESTHQVTNEWGAYKLAHTGGFKNVMSEIEEKMKYTKSLYFKYLKQSLGVNEEESESLNSSSKSNPKNVFLLIDDNHDKGWDLVFKAIIEDNIPDCSLISYKKEKIKDTDDGNTEFIDDVKNLIKTPSPKIIGILLDLRLTSKDEDQANQHTNITNFTGGKVLKELKRKYPYLPVIMVTASNKAWNMRNLLNEGADGYFIKEGVDIPTELEISKHNLEAFKALLRQSKEKFETLSVFWKYIEDIKSRSIIKNAPPPNSTLINERIEERLNMFFGLLKRGFEDTQYNERFYYSDIKLAFMTLWSCLNDIQYACYDTTAPFNIIIYPDLVGGLSVFLQEHEVTTNTKYTHIDFSSKPLPRFTIKKDKNKNSLARDIGKQIAFLLIKVCNLTENDPLLTDLFELKNKRNYMYLTHGAEASISSTFYSKTEQNNMDISLSDCKKLFEIVYLLVTKTRISI